MPSPRALPPHPAIRAAVLGYFAVGPSPEAHRHRILPDGCLDLVFNLADARGSHGGAVEPPAAVVGALTRPVVVERPPNAPLIGVTLAPTAARSLLRVSPDTLNNRLLDLDALWGA